MRYSLIVQIDEYGLNGSDSIESGRYPKFPKFPSGLVNIQVSPAQEM